MIASALPLVFIIGAIAALAATGNLLSMSPFVIAAQILAVMLNVWARASFKKGTFRVAAAPAGSSIITDGPYRLIRHPMYSAVLLFVWAGVVSHLSALTISIGIAVTAVAIVRVIVEERLLRASCPGYADYAKSTKRLIPLVF